MERQSSSDEQRTAFGDALRDAMAASDYNGQRLADVLGGNKATVNKWVNGKSEPTRPQVAAIERILGLDVGELSRHLGYVPAVTGATVVFLEDGTVAVITDGPADLPDAAKELLAEIADRTAKDSQARRAGHGGAANGQASPRR